MACAVCHYVGLPETGTRGPHTSHVSNGSLRNTFALFLVLLALTTEQAAIWQHYDCSSSLEASFSEPADSCRADVFIHTALSSSN